MKLAVAFIFTASLLAQSLQIVPSKVPLPLTHPVQDKNFYLLTLLESVSDTPALQKVANNRLAMMDSGTQKCALDIECYAAAFRWTDSQIAEVASDLKATYTESAAMRAMVDGPLRQSGMYSQHGSLAGPEFLERAWGECAAGLNRMIDVYGLGKPPRYAEIDSMMYDPKAPAYQRVMQNLVLVMVDDRASLKRFYSPSERFAIELLLLNHRDEAGRFEPMDQGQNRAAVVKVKTVDWTKFPYSAIMVPGAGGDRPGVRLSAAGKLRDEIAAKRWRDGKAPFIIVSGGFVHPNRTEFAEAIEMKRDLMERFSIPESAIVVDPHARHTTTNMRNAARLMYRYGMPFDKKALVTTDPGQSLYIQASLFEERCMDELGYVPYRLLGRISLFDLEFIPKIESLQADAREPLDP